MDRWSEEILGRFEARADAIAEEIAVCTVAEVPGFRPIQDATLIAEIRALARSHLDAFLRATRSGEPPDPPMIAAARARAMRRAREMVPLASLLHSYLIAQRVISAAIARASGIDSQSRGAALALTATTFDYNIAVTSAMADAYVEVVQGDLAELDAARRSLVDALITNESDALPALSRRATGLGLDPDREYVVVLGVIEPIDEPATGFLRQAAQAIARSTGRPERQAFVIGREQDLLALLDARGSSAPQSVLESAAVTIKQVHGAVLRCGLGPPFAGLAGFAASYREARRALRHAVRNGRSIVGPGDLRLFEELTSAGAESVVHLIPESLMRVVADPATRSTLESLIQADLNIAVAAKALSLHPNSLRYRLRRIAEKSGCNPRKLSDLLELIAAVRLVSTGATPERSAAAAT